MKYPMMLLLAAVSATGCAATDEPDASAAAGAQSGQRECFHASSVNGFSPRGDRAVDVRVGANQHYRLEVAGFCPDVDWSQAIAIRTRGGSSWICRGLDAELIVPSPTGSQRCLVQSVRRLSDAEAEAAREAD